MKYITVFANCQGEAIAKFLKMGLPQDHWQVDYFSNNPRLGNMKNIKDIVEGIRKSDILIYQPLKEAHGELSETNIKQIVRKETISVSFAHIYNTGVYSLDINPHHPRNSYGAVYGEEIIINLLKEYAFSEVIELYRNGLIDFDLKNRFQISLTEMQRRETQTDIKLSNFILDNYQKKKLFTMHCHPTTKVFVEICSQIKMLTRIPFSYSAIDIENENLSNLPGQAPISPYDVTTHGYSFAYHQDWFNHGAYLIKLVADNNKPEKEKEIEIGSKVPSQFLESPDLLNLHAEKIYHSGNRGEAKKILLYLTERWPEYANALNNLGVLYWEEGFSQKAEEYFSRAFRADPNDKNILLNVGEMLISQNQHETVRQLYRLFLKNKPDEEIGEALEKLETDTDVR